MSINVTAVFLIFIGEKRHFSFHLILMTTKNLTKSFQGKITGKHLPPLAITNKQVTTNADEFVPNSILKKIKTDKEEINDDDDDLLLLDTYPPKSNRHFGSFIRMNCLF